MWEKKAEKVKWVGPVNTGLLTEILLMTRKAEGENQEKKATVEGLPLESSPYVKYTNLEDYKRNAYGSEGHLPVKLNQSGGGTDAPTISGTHNQIKRLSEKSRTHSC
ncbi:uncharacterized protein LOC116128550 [Pistacia vera]|uniref:uncharacterized protein LOC116128550 n=1 Tax=Pistacia vera TaxID=55513 RepID=UPI001263A211|nr:uncharacterized protein LOC116128550 [Pistacia vera]